MFPLLSFKGVRLELNKGKVDGGWWFMVNVDGEKKTEK